MRASCGVALWKSVALEDRPWREEKEPMKEIKGIYNVAKVFTDNVEETAASQIYELMDQEFVKGSRVRIMPDCHAGAGCTIGTTMTITDKVVPNLVGVDLGCGVFVGEIDKKKIDMERLDDVIRDHVPSGTSVHKTGENVPILRGLRCSRAVDMERAKRSVGTLGGGNHFIEVSKDEEENYYLLIHTGSRQLGKSIATFYQDLAAKELLRDIEVARVRELNRKGTSRDSASLNLESRKFNKNLAYLEGQNLEDYLNDVRIAQAYASLNRQRIAEIIAEHMGWRYKEVFQTVHNYIDVERNILRKGAVSAQKGEKLVIPINMRDGSFICIGKGNEDWNYSAPHGAGRVMSRTKAKAVLSMKDFESSMKGIYTTSVNRNTLDEAPFAYKPFQEIMENIQDTVDIVKRLKPVYNFKAAD